MSYFPKTGEENMYDKVVEIINIFNLDGEDVLRIMCDYYGLQLLDDGFMEHLNSEGYEV